MKEEESILRRLLIAINSNRIISKFNISIDKQIQFIRFCIVGASNTIISYIIYTLSLLLFRRFSLFVSIDYYIAQVMAFITSVAWSFFWNNRVVFKIENGQKRNLFLSLLKSYASYSFTGLFLSGFLLWIWIDNLKISEYIAPFLNLIICIPVNFLLNKYWTFKTTKE